MIKIIPILLGVVGSYAVAALCHMAGMNTMDPVKLQELANAPWIGLPFAYENTLFGLFSRPDLDRGLLLTSAVTIMPLALATMVEHIGDMCAISSTCERNYLENPGFHRTLLGDGLATSLATVHFAQYPLATIPGAVFSVWHNVSGAILANFFARTADKK